MSIEQLNCDVYVTKQEMEIKRLREENEKLREALDKCVEAMEFTYDYFDGPVAVVQDAKDAIRAAGAALKETGDEWRKQNDLV